MKRLFIIVIFFFNLSAYAGSGNGLVGQIIVHPSPEHSAGIVMFTLPVNGGKAACSIASSWAFSLNSELGRAMYQLLLEAMARNKPIGVHGAGDCSVWGDRERPYYIYINK